MLNGVGKGEWTRKNKACLSVEEKEYTYLTGKLGLCKSRS